MDRFLQDRKVFLFPGVGVKYKKFLRLFNEEQLKKLKRYTEIINSELNIDLWSYANSELDSETNNEFLEWILIYACDCIVYRTYIKKGIKPDVFVGYSMGVITAMVCAEALSFEAGLNLLNNIYLYPTKAKRKEEAMATIIGLDYNDVRKIIEEVNLEEYVEIASENSDYCIVISGIKNAVCKIMEIAEEQGAIKTIKLNSTYAFHSSYALGGIESMYNFIKGMEINQAKIPIMSIFTQKLIIEKKDLKRELLINVSSSMKWKDTILKLGEIGKNKFVEVSLNDALTKISRVINLEYEFSTYQEIVEFNI
ncbi:MULTISPECIES: ACP S-malonyltransferase [Clostridium]|uniref:ACP S-malonyltransferase n=1 Tax=Clostridium TaxID=1485 RepID=UPI0008250744|nr:MULTISPECIES: ACP S-malonyltransferase [Clostridium]PJI09451.1 ACP S-malonyltransferase [Clostridium sp. CT7]